MTDELSALDEAWRFFPDTYARKINSGRFHVYRHIDLIAEKITPALYSGGGRFIIELPPRHGKSEFISKNVPAWFLDTFPARNVILTSYGDELASGFGRWVRDHFASNPYAKASLKAGSHSASRFGVVHKVWNKETEREEEVESEMITAGIGGAITGKGGHLLICDDPFKNWEEANSPVYRKKVKDWFDSTFYTRQEPNATIIVLQTRWHYDDLIGYLKNEHKDKWVSITLPAFAIDPNDMLGRAEGEVLCPERYDHAAMTALKNGLPSQKWEPLYMQRPSKDGGTIFNRGWWQYYEKIPTDITHKVQFWDTASKPGISNDYSVCATWGVSASGYYLLDLWRDKVELPELEEAVVQQYNKWNPVAVVVEDKNSGTSILQLGKKFSRIPMIPYDPKQKSKENRAIDASPTIKAKKAFLPKNAAFTSDFVTEHEHFPATDHDDQVDTTSMAIDYFSNLELQDNQPRVTSL